MAFGIDDAVTAASNLLNTAINKIWPDPADKAKAEAITMAAAADASINTMKVQMSLAIAEAQSGDKWTSRARPSFMYVMYTLILWALPMGFISAWKPDLATAIAGGMKAWLAAVPDMLWQVFGWCFGAYAAGRSGEKIIGMIKK